MAEASTAHDDRELTDEQRAVLELIYAPFREGGEWPEYQYVERSIYRSLGRDAREVLSSFPPGLIYPEPSFPSFYAQRDQPLALTVGGIAKCAGAEGDVRLFISSLRLFVQVEAEHEMPPTGGEPPSAGSDELRSRLDLTEEEVGRVYQLFRTELGLLGGGGGNPTTWRFELIPDIRRFADVATIEDYLELRVVPRPYRRAFLPPGSEGGSAQPGAAQSEVATQASSPDPRAVFVVHGRDAEVRAAMWSYLQDLGLHPLEWDELVCSTGTVTPFTGEVLESAFSKAQAVVVLMTPDDEARLHAELHAEDEPDYELNLTCQPRPNVLFEAGMAFGAHPTRTILVEVGRLRPISDLAGRNVVRLGKTKAPLKALADRLVAAGCAVDQSHDGWLATGRFASLTAYQRRSEKMTERGPEPLRRGTVLPQAHPPAAPPLLTARLHSRGRDGYLLEVVNRGGAPLLNVQWEIREAQNWHVLTDVLPEYPVAQLQPRDYVRIPVAITLGGPVIADMDLHAVTEEGKDYETTVRLSIYG